MAKNLVQSINSFLQTTQHIHVDPCGCRNIRDTMQIIAKQILSPNFMSGYDMQRKLLKCLFVKTSGPQYSKENIMLRLTALDSLYSTNASKSYFTIEDIVEEIWNIPGSSNMEDNANFFFKDVANGLIVAKNGINVDNWFNKNFGLHKNCKQGHRKISLLSKYAYYCCLLLKGNTDGFPIYDSFALETFPFAFKILWPSASSNNLESLVKAMTPDSNSQKQIPISSYVNAMNTLCNGLGLNKSIFLGMQKYDILDAYLWRMGKLCNGNLSLIVGRQDYEKIIDQLSLKNIPSEKDSDYYKRLSSLSKFQGVLNCSIKDIKKPTLLPYPTIFNNKICNKKIIENSGKNLKKTYTGNFGALTLYSLITKNQSGFMLTNKNAEQYFNSLYKHWCQYYKY